MAVEVVLPLSFWVETVNTACCSQNCSVIGKHHGNTSYKILKGRTIDISYFNIFGCMFYILNQRDKLTKFKAKADNGVFLGCSSVSKAFLVFNLLRKTEEETAHFTFNEESFIHDLIDRHSSILNELTFSSSDHIPNLLLNVTEPIVPNANQFVDSYLNYKD